MFKSTLFKRHLAGSPKRRYGVDYCWDAAHPPNPNVVLRKRDFADQPNYQLAPQALSRCVDKLLDDRIGFIRIPNVEKLYPDISHREAFLTSLPMALFRHDPLGFIRSLERHLPVHPHGHNLRQAMLADPNWFKALNVDFSHRYREHGDRFISPDDDIYRGHYAHHEYTGDERDPDQIVLMLANGFWGFNQIEGTEPVIMDMEAYRRDINRKSGREIFPEQPKVVGGPKDPEFLPNDPRREFSYVVNTDYSRSADIIILNNVRVAHSRMPGRRLPPHENVRRPLYQCDFTIGRYGRTPVLSAVTPKQLAAHHFKNHKRYWRTGTTPFDEYSPTLAESSIPRRDALHSASEDSRNKTMRGTPS